MWDSKKPDERLDNFSTDIDILDAFEYSWEPFISKLCPDMKKGDTVDIQAVIKILNKAWAPYHSGLLPPH